MVTYNRTSETSGSSGRVPFDPHLDDDIGLPDDDIGLPLNDDIGLSLPELMNDVGHGLEGEQEEDIGLELPDHELSPPQDPNPHFEDICNELVFTLASRYQGYSNLQELRNDFQVDSGYLADRIAYEFGFPNFETFVKSEQMKKFVSVQMIDGKPVFVPSDFSKFQHIRNEQQFSLHHQLNSDQKREHDKLARAMLPENTEEMINGRRIISEIVYELGGEEKEILWFDVQARYREKNGVELAGQELRKYFQRDKALRIVETLMHEEFELSRASHDGHFYLKLKKPFKELLNIYEEKLRDQRLGKMQQNAGRQFTGSSVNRRRSVPVHPIGPMNPYSSSNNFPVKESTNELNNAADKPQSFTQKQPLATKEKFNLPGDVLRSKSFFDEIGGGEGTSNSQPVTSGSSQRINWKEQKLSTYEPNAPNDSSNSSAKTNNNVQPSAGKKSVKYTKTLAGQDFTSSEGSDNDDEAGGDEDYPVTPKNSQQNVLEETSGSKQVDINVQISDTDLVFNSKNQGDISQDAQFELKNKTVHPPKENVHSRPIGPSGHQKGIQEYMKTSMLTKPHLSGQQQQPSAAMKNPMMPVNNFSRHRRPSITCSSDEEADNELGNERKTQQQQQEQFNPTQPNTTTIKSNSQQSMLSTGVGVGATHVKSHNLGPTMSTSAFGQVSNASFIGGGGARFMLSEHVDELRALANSMKFSHENRLSDEGSFAFRLGNNLLILTERAGDVIRASWHSNGILNMEHNWTKMIDWEFFRAAIRGLLMETLEIMSATSGIETEGHLFPDRDRPIPWGCPPNKMSTYVPDLKEDGETRTEDKAHTPKRRTLIGYVFPPVPEDIKSLGPPYPAYRTTKDGQHDFLCFFTRVYGFSNHYSAEFTLDRVKYCCSEQYYKFHKATYFGYHNAADEIMLLKDPKAIKVLGDADTLRQRKAEGKESAARIFDHAEWHGVKKNIMKAGVRAKITQNKDLLDMLLRTYPAFLVESSPTDLCWGNGCHMDTDDIEDPGTWQGTNWMGRLLMEIREDLMIAKPTPHISNNLAFPPVPEDLKKLGPPYPAYRTTKDGQHGFLCFFTRVYGFSNHYLTDFIVNGVKYCCSEQYYKFHKATYFGYHNAADEIMLLKEPKAIKVLGDADTLRQRKAEGRELAARTFDHAEWHGVKKNIMKAGVRAKVTQNKDLLDMLLRTYPALLVESSPTDVCWGNCCHMDSDAIGYPSRWEGTNWMGRLLMELREELL